MTADVKLRTPQEGRMFARSAASGVMWLLGQSISARLISLVSQIVLAWLLLPADFGNVGLALTMASFAGTFVNFGIDDVLLQRQKTIRFWLSSAVWLSLGLGVVSMIFLLVAAPAAGWLFGSPAITPLIYVLAIAIPFGSLATVPTVLLSSALNFRVLALCTMAELITLQVATMALAWAGAGQFSFVIPVPIVAALKACVLWWIAAPQLKSPMRISQVRYFLSKGLLVTVNRMLTVAVENGDYIVLGLMTKPEIVGLYFFAFRLAALPVRTLAANFQRVMFPVLAKLNAEPERQERAAVEASQLLAFAVMPLCFLQAAIAEPLLLFLFGEKWQGTIPFAQILSLGLPFDAVAWVATALMSARGEFRRSLAYTAAQAGCFFMFVGTGALFGAMGVAIAVALYYSIAPVVLSRLVYGSMPGLTIAKLFLLPMAVAAAAVSMGYFASLIESLQGRLLLRVFVISAIAALAYPALLRVVAPTAFQAITQRLRLILNRSATSVA